jgi:glycosyltransferase involved in cell wall biosynthesis
MRPTISIAICTRNHPADLSVCLQSLFALREKPLEIIVVDNDSSGDATRRIVDSFGVRYVHEPVVGPESARNCAVRFARGDIVAFTDDDCQVDPGWVSAIADAFSDPKVGTVTGQAICGNDANWVQRQFNSFARGFCLLVPVEMTPAEVGDLYYRAVVGVGANMACRRDLLLDLGGFTVLTAGAGGEDDYLLIQSVRAGYTARYTPASIVYQQHRAALPDTLLRFVQYGLGEMRILWYLSAEDRNFTRFVKNVAWMYRRNLRQFATCAIRGRWWHMLFSLSILTGYAAGTFIPWGWRAHLFGKLPARGGLNSSSHA